MTTQIVDAETVTKTALFGGAETLFDAYWYREKPEARHGRFLEAARLFRDRIAATRMFQIEWRIDLRKVFASAASSPDPANQRS